MRASTKTSNQSGNSSSPPPPAGFSGSRQQASAPQIAFPPFSRRPVFCLYETPFTVGSETYLEGVYYHFIEEQKDKQTGTITEIMVDQWICSILKVLCVVRTDGNNEHSYLIEYVAHGENFRRRVVLPQAALLGRLDELKALRDIGVSVLYDNLKHVRSYLDRQHRQFSCQTPDDFWQSVKSVGWAPVPIRFVLPTEIIGQQAGVWFSAKGDLVQYNKSGEFARWQEHVAKPCEGNSFLILALSCAFTGPLLEPLNIPGVGLHYFGDSTTGKSTALALASSVWGSPKFMISWRSTVNGLEIQAASRSSTFLALDESHMIDAKALDASVYLLLNGVSKARMSKDAGAREVSRWRLPILSCGERSIESHIGTGHIDHKVGQGVRLIDIPVTGSLGLFDDLHGATSGSAFADALRDAAAADYGHAGPLFVSSLIEKFSLKSLTDWLASALAHFADKDNPLSAQELRVARCFALIAVAGELAIKRGILPWEKRAAISAAIEIFRHWRSTQPSSEKGKEHAQIIESVADFFDQHGISRFLDINWTPTVNKFGDTINSLPIIRDHAGYWEDTPDGRIYFLTPSGFKEACGSFGVRRVINALLHIGVLTRDTGGRASHSLRVPEGGTKRLYRIDPSHLDQA